MIYGSSLIGGQEGKGNKPAMPTKKANSPTRKIRNTKHMTVSEGGWVGGGGALGKIRMADQC